MKCTELGPNTYRGNRPLTKPDRRSRGLRGNLCGQAVLVAMEASPPEFKPHSFHSYFVKAVRDNEPLTWKVQEVSTGRTLLIVHYKLFSLAILFYCGSVFDQENSISKTKSAENKPSLSVRDSNR